MGGLDAVAGLFAVVGGALSAGQVQIVVQQANIPITMLLSRLYLKVSSYAWSQYVGASIIVLGGLLSAFGAGGAAGGGPLGDGGGVSAHVVWFGPVLILIGIIPGSMSNVYKEENFKTHNLDIYFLTTYVAVWQTALSFLCVPLFTLSYFGGIPYESHTRTSLIATATQRRSTMPLAHMCVYMRLDCVCPFFSAWMRCRRTWWMVGTASWAVRCPVTCATILPLLPACCSCCTWW
jgi:hypothetical protein